ncbi:MAG TPA: CRISPR-associated endonuclease Cas1 [Terriglobales bacterium]|nr:CRISPR-associated endonuclease Cas1 [Terriglobales bacterium]
MTATETVPQLPSSRKSPISKSGVLTLSGFGIRVRMQSGHLEIEDGIADERRRFRLPRVASCLRRLVMIGSDGFITFDALRWLADIGASFAMLDRRGKLLFATGPTASTDTRLRRAQALALGNGTALRISQELIRQKLQGQSALVRDMLHDAAAAGAIERFRQELPSAESIESVRLIEAQAAKLYWHVWCDLPVRWPRQDERRIPEHWKRFNSRISSLTHSPRLAANPPNAILNLLYAVLEAESRIAAVAMGLDPGIGLLHVDTPNRDSLACDLMEPVRPAVDAFVLNWLQREPLRKADFVEDSNGNARMASALAIKLCETADTWRKLVAPGAEHVAQELWLTASRSLPALARRRMLATRLTQRSKREAKGSDMPAITPPKIEHHCQDCGKEIRRDLRRRFCAECAVTVIREGFDWGRKAAQRPESLAKRSATQRIHKQAIKNWKPSDLPAWLTRDLYVKQVQPALASVAKSRIRSALGVSEPYASDIQAGKRVPHPRHWHALAELVEVKTGLTRKSKGSGLLCKVAHYQSKT